MRDKLSSLDEILGMLESGIAEYMDSDKFRRYLKAVGRFHSYSSRNVLLITMQMPEASLVAGYSTWKNSFKRSVRKGEHGIKIIAPVPTFVEKTEDRIDEFGNLRREKVTIKIPRFRTVTVFDVSQTEGEPLPNIDPSELTGRVDGYKDLVAALERVSPVPIKYSDIEGTARGWYSPLENEICIQRGMPEAQTVKTLVHEISHSLLHTKETGALKPQRIKETEAESVAFAVCSHFGIDTSDYSFPYLSAWSGECGLETFRNSLRTIKDTSSELISEAEGGIRELKRERGAEDIAASLGEFSLGYGEGDIKEMLLAGNTADLEEKLKGLSLDETDMKTRDRLGGLLFKVRELAGGKDCEDRDKEEAER